MSDVYTDNGYINRQDYLENLSIEYDVNSDIVFNLAELLGPSEDFDGLVTTLEDYTNGY